MAFHLFDQFLVEHIAFGDGQQALLVEQFRIILGQFAQQDRVILADVVAVTIDDAYMDEAGKFHLNDTGLITYSHGEYFLLGKKLGTFGYSVRKDTPGKRSNSLKGDDRKKKSRKNKSFPQKPSRVKEKLPGQKGILQQKNMKTDQNNFR